MKNKIFDNQYFKPFYFSELMENINYELFLDEKIIYIPGDIFFVSKCQFQSFPLVGVSKKGRLDLNINSIKLIDNDYFDNCDMKLIKITNNKIIECETFNEFHFFDALIKKEVEYIRSFLDCIIAHLKNRISEEENLINSNLIKVSIGKIIMDMNSIICFISNDVEMADKSAYRNIIDLIRKISHRLAKLAGGRAFLQSSILDMLFVFEVVNRLYLNGGN